MQTPALGEPEVLNPPLPPPASPGCFFGRSPRVLWVSSSEGAPLTPLPAASPLLWTWMNASGMMGPVWSRMEQDLLRFEAQEKVQICLILIYQNKAQFTRCPHPPAFLLLQTQLQAADSPVHTRNHGTVWVGRGLQNHLLPPAKQSREPPCHGESPVRCFTANPGVFLGAEPENVVLEGSPEGQPARLLASNKSWTSPDVALQCRRCSPRGIYLVRLCHQAGCVS